MEVGVALSQAEIDALNAAFERKVIPPEEYAYRIFKLLSRQRTRKGLMVVHPTKHHLIITQEWVEAHRKLLEDISLSYGEYTTRLWQYVLLLGYIPPRPVSYDFFTVVFDSANSRLTSRPNISPLRAGSPVAVDSTQGWVIPSGDISEALGLVMAEPTDTPITSMRTPEGSETLEGQETSGQILRGLCREMREVWKGLGESTLHWKGKEYHHLNLPQLFRLRSELNAGWRISDGYSIPTRVPPPRSPEDFVGLKPSLLRPTKRDIEITEEDFDVFVLRLRDHLSVMLQALLDRLPDHA